MTVSVLRIIFVMMISAATMLYSASASFRMSGPVTVCDDEGESRPPSFERSGCTTLAAIELVDPQDRSLWVRGEFSLAPGTQSRKRPTGIFVIGKASSELWLNGIYLGANGHPSRNKDDEVAGLMDAVYFAPASALREGKNQITIRFSSHRGFIKLRYPLHGVIIGDYNIPTAAALHDYIPAALTLGVFLLGAIYFGASAFYTQSRTRSFLLAVLCLLAAGQLVSELLRGFYAYAYPVHDLRLVAILAFSAAFGLIVCGYVFLRYARRTAVLGLAGVVAAMAIVIAIAPGFDAKSITALLIPVSAAAALSAWKSFAGRRHHKRGGGATAIAVGLGAFAALIILRTDQFLDVYFFLAVAGLIAFLFYQESKHFAEERTARLAETDRAAKLQHALEKAAQKSSPKRLALKDGAASVFVDPGDIISCSAAGDYVEVRVIGSNHILHSGTLGELEACLNESFLRIHRSHIVNVDHVRALTREGAAGGQLEMAEGDPLPVSRRIMPRVRASLVVERTS